MAMAKKAPAKKAPAKKAPARRRAPAKKKSNGDTTEFGGFKIKR